MEETVGIGTTEEIERDHQRRGLGGQTEGGDGAWVGGDTETAHAMAMMDMMLWKKIVELVKRDAVHL
ncbi:uncharacterized protein LTR77_002296 [Saxophila tyrrhenica]|uniref:Uncharacterized protein n=1 Tax=Saxophila tyrrhenica TaxID=1690608 RepID=A0AAV9PIS4_9PEZI|nr:hypothetical protein LTR77_002296 [Saxophila tyrrhenica]